MTAVLRCWRPSHPTRRAGAHRRRRRRVREARASRAAAGRQPQPGVNFASRRRRWTRQAIRFGLAVIKNVGTGGCRRDHRGARGEGPVRLASRTSAGVPTFAPEQAGAGEHRSRRARSTAWVTGHAAGEHRPHPLAGAAGAAAARVRPDDDVRPLRRDGRHAAPDAGARAGGRLRARRCWPGRRSCWASTSPSTPSRRRRRALAARDRRLQRGHAEMAGREVVLAGMVASTRNLLPAKGKHLLRRDHRRPIGQRRGHRLARPVRSDARPLDRGQHPHRPGARSESATTGCR